MSDMDSKIAGMRDLWNELSDKDSLKYVSHLQEGASRDVAEFHLTGIRFVDRMAERFLDYGGREFSLCEVAEIGCGVGRFTKVLASRFKHVHGFDISSSMIRDAKNYCSSMPNITWVNNDGASLKGLADASVDYVCTAGVFQHITHIGVILSYLREGLRVLRPGGLLLFQFEANKTEAEGERGTGARIHAQALDEGLGDLSFDICEMSLDPLDPIRNMVIVLRRTDAPARETDRFAAFPVTERRWISGVYDDIRTKSAMHENLKKQFKPMTFFTLQGE